MSFCAGGQALKLRKASNINKIVSFVLIGVVSLKIAALMPMM